MKERFEQFMLGRQGMDELSKAMFWSALGLFVLFLFFSTLKVTFLASLFLWFSMFALMYSFGRAFSRNLGRREAENQAYLALRQKQKAECAARAERRSQSKEFVFFKCPSCKTMLRVPRGKGKIHINCKCGYTLYRKT